jgi:hypothetical protein
MSAAPDPSRHLILQFEGWCQIRQPTDPDPFDERRGSSGYTFAFGDEPDLDRIIRLQPSTAAPVRSHGWEIGVTVKDAVRHDGPKQKKIDELHRATVDLLGEPKFENRNWTLTAAGYEPIVPFELEISSPSLTIRRTAPLDPEHPHLPVWDQTEDALAAQAAKGMNFEPATVGSATGIWDSLQVAIERRKKLENDLGAAKAEEPPDDAKIAILTGRIAELTIGIETSDRRVMARQYVERFAFPMLGHVTIEGDEEKVLGGKLARGTREGPFWNINFWLGAWDPDVLSAYLVGSLDAPFAKD